MRPTALRALATVVLLAALAAEGATPAAAQLVDRPGQSPVAGARVFGAKGCNKCHAINGLGGTVGPDLGKTTRPRSLYDLGAAMWNHLPAMLERMEQLGIQRPRLGADEVGDLIAFLFTVDYFDPPGDPHAGEPLFVDKGCVLCHQVGGVGGVIGPNLDAVASLGSPIAVAAAMWNHGPAMSQAMGARGVPRPAFSDRELIDLVAFLKSAAPVSMEAPVQAVPGSADEGRRLFALKRCVECHGEPGQGGRVGPDLAERTRGLSLTQFAAAMWNKQPAMARAMAARGIPAPQVSAGEMADLVAYLYSVRYLGGRGDVARGRALVTRKGCTACHALAGAGGRSAADLSRVRRLDSAAAVIAALWNHGLVMRDRGERRGVSWPRLTPEEMADLVAFFAASGAPR